MPCGDAVSRRLARTWQTELGAFGLRDGKPVGAGEHDDMVIASWYVELAVGRLQQLLAMQPAEELVTMEDLGIEPVRIGEAY